MTKLWIVFVIAQILSAGHINYQQEAGYYELNPLYGKYPSKSQVYITKGVETLIVYGATKAFPKYEKHILLVGTSVCFGFMAWDKSNGIALKFRF